jgi:uncharacterized Zn finger protein (UPF0148 family)
MSFRVVCPKCGKKTMIAPMLRGGDLGHALENDGEIEVVCFSCDHRWKLNAEDRAEFRKRRKEELSDTLGTAPE